MLSLVSYLFRLLFARLGLLIASGDRRDAEILALRHLDRVILIVQPATVIGWHKRLVARHWTNPHKSRGRPATPAELRRLVLRLDSENPTLGYRRITGEIVRLGHRIAPSTVWSILRKAGHEPSPQRTGPSRSEFIASQAKAMVATDFFTVDAVLLRRFYVLFVIEINSRRVHIAGITTSPDGPWTTQAARNLVVDWGHPTRFLIRDRGSQFIGSFDNVFNSIGVDVIVTPPGAPRANAFAERWVRSVRHEFLDRTLIWNQRQLLNEYVAHYNRCRPHQALDQRAPNDAEPAPLVEQARPVTRTAVCGGLINQYRPAA